MKFDFNIGVKYGLDVYVPVDDKGYMTEDTGEDFAGLFYEDANGSFFEEIGRSWRTFEANGLRT